MSTHSSGYYSIDADYNIIGFNDTAKQIYPSLKVGQKCYKALMGLDAHIAKPLDITKMMRTIAQYRR